MQVGALELSHLGGIPEDTGPAELVCFFVNARFVTWACLLRRGLVRLSPEV